MGHEVASSTFVAGSVPLPLSSEEIEPVVKGVRVQVPVPLYPVATCANVCLVFLPCCCAESPIQSHPVLLCKLYLLVCEQVLPQELTVLDLAPATGFETL